MQAGVLSGCQQTAVSVAAEYRQWQNQPINSGLIRHLKSIRGDFYGQNGVVYAA